MVKRTAKPSTTDDDDKPIQAAPEPILNRPYEEPKRHWLYKDGTPFVMEGRRPASYWYKDKKVGAAQGQMFAEEQRDDLELVNRLRTDVKRWRESKYRGASAVTRDLFAYWFRADRPRRLFFCQREAVETLVYLLELALPGKLSATGYKTFEVTPANIEKLSKGERPDFAVKTDAVWPRLVDQPADAGLLALSRLGCKMATGSGKTLVMAMLVTWAFCNRGRGGDDRFPSAVLICSPNLTVKKRLQVLKPDYEGRNYYDEFDLVPSKYRDLLGAGRVIVTNWHVFAPKSEHREGDASYTVVQKGEETAEAFTKDRLGELADRLPILVLNDEGHHCWRSNTDAQPDTKGLSSEEKKALEEEKKEARVWLDGLDRINNCGIIGTGVRGIVATIDLSATPFYLGNSGYPEGSPFPWLVSDFGLVDAIESGIVKIPRLPVLDDTGETDDAGRPDPKYFRLWRHVLSELKASDRVGKKVKPDAIYKYAESALQTLVGQWRQKFLQNEAESSAERPVPPVLIAVCDNVEIADYMYRRISGEKLVTRKNEKGKDVDETVYGDSSVLAELTNTEAVKRTIRIDTDLLSKIETEEGESKDEAATRLRTLIDTVGKKGQPGEQVRCIVSVSMLTEGWDANNVTHILGLRAFDSQLLCEQVVGRGLRRMSYDVNSDGLLEAEYVDVYGIPFSLIPFKGKPQKTEVSDKPQHHVYAVPEKAALRIEMPVVEGYTYDVQASGIRCDLSKAEGLLVADEPIEVYLTAPRGYEEEGKLALGDESYTKQTRAEFYQTVRLQQVLFRLAQFITDDLVGGARGPGKDEVQQSLHARHQIFGDVLRIVTDYVKQKVKFAPGVDEREIGMEKYAQLLRERVRAAILTDRAPEAKLLPITNEYSPIVSTDDVDENTTHPVYRLAKSHLNAAAVRSIGKGAPIGEQTAIDLLESLDVVEAFAPNSRKIGFQVPYEYQGDARRYEPDFVVRLRSPNGEKRMLLLEIKGLAGELHNPDEVNAKNQAAKQWCEAVNNAGRCGRWTFEIARSLAELEQKLRAYEPPAAHGKVLPFRFVDVKAKKGVPYKDCVPLVSLRAAATKWSDEQASLEFTAEQAEDWVAWDRPKGFSQGMFVARVNGKSMEPDVPDGSYCLFREFSGGSPEGRKLLLWHNAISDWETGGQFTLKVFTKDKSGKKVVLKPLNKDHEPFELKVKSDDDVRIVAELAEVLPQPSG